MKKTTLILIRHGTTTYNFKKRYSGFTDVRLSEEGKNQAKLLCQRLKDERVDIVYSSDRIRAMQTARIIFKDKRIEKIASLREINFGIFEGLTHKEIMDRHAEVYSQWLKDHFKTNVPKAETLRSFKRRVTASFKNIIADNIGRSVAIICHGGSIGIFISSILKSRDFWKHIVRPASITIIECNKEKQKIKLQNDTSHLNG